MARVAVGVVFGFVVGVLGGAAAGLHAEDLDGIGHDTVAAANEAGVELVPLLGAMASTQLPARAYLIGVGELAPPATSPQTGVASSSTPLGAAPASSSRLVECIEAKESGGANIANRRGSGAVGVMQYMPSTFAAHAREMGHPEWSPWNPAQARAVAVYDLALGRRSQWTVSGC